MTLRNGSDSRKVNGIDDAERDSIKAFLQGAVYCWVKMKGNEPFAARDLVGGANRDWGGTPLQVLYSKHANHGKDNDAAMEAAAKDVGWLLKSVLIGDKREFESSDSGWSATYHWVP
jgi:hypothetical protein